MELVWIRSDIGVTGESKMATGNRQCKHQNAAFSFYTWQQPDFNGNPIFSGSSREFTNLVMLLEHRKNRTSFRNHFASMYTSWYIRYCICTSRKWRPSLIYQSSQRRNSSASVPALLLNPENMDIAVGISLLSCIRAEIYVMSFLFPVNGRHLRFPTYLDVE